MYCSTCGKKNADDAQFCTVCGKPMQSLGMAVPQQQTNFNSQNANGNAVNVIAFAFTIISAILCVVFLSNERMEAWDLLGFLCLSAGIALVSLIMVLILKIKKKLVNAFGWLALVFDIAIILLTILYAISFF